MSKIQKIEKWIKNYMVEQKNLGRPLQVLRMKAWRTVPSVITMNSKTYRGNNGFSVDLLGEFFACDTPTLLKLNQGRETFHPGDRIIIPGKALNVSYTKDGLKWTLNKYGSLLYYQDTVLTMKRSDGSMGYVPRFQGTFEMNDRVFVEDFIPRDHIAGDRMHQKNQSIEFFWCNKAQKLLYVSGR